MLTASAVAPQLFGTPVAVDLNYYSYMESLTETYSRQLWRFMRTTLVPAVPRLTWWALGLVGFSWLNLLFLTELWPHHPKAEKWLVFVLVLCLFTLLWLGAYTAQRVRWALHAGWWNTLWLFAMFGGYALVGCLTLVVLVFCSYIF